MSRQVDLGQIIPNIQVGTTTTGLPSSQASVVNVGTDLNPILNFTIPKGEPGAIQMIIVNELPQTGQEDTIYLVPLAIPETEDNRYAEYIYVNNQWELLGKIGIQVDLSDYYTKSQVYNKEETDTKVNAKYTKPSDGIPKEDLTQSVQTSLNKADSSIQDVSGKEDKSNKVTSLSSSSTDIQYPSAKCVYDSQEEQDTNIQDLQEENNELKGIINNIYDIDNYLLKNHSIESEETTESITLNNTMNKAPMSLTLKGNIEQDGEPTPQTPVDIHIVSGDNEIKVCNKNLFDGEMELGTINSSGELVTSNNYIRSKNFTPIIGDVELFLSSNLTGYTRHFIYFYDEEYNFISVLPRAISYSFTTPSNAKYLKFRPDLQSNDTNVKFQLEKGSTATDYVPHQEYTKEINLGDIEVGSIGEYEDEFFKNTTDSEYYDSTLELDKWYLKKRIGKVVLDGSETINYMTYGENKRFSIVPTNYTNTIYYSSNTINCISNNFRINWNETIGGRAQNATSPCLFCHSSAIMITMTPDYNVSTSEQMSAFLSTHNTEVYYVLATPENILLNDTLQETLDSFVSYQEQTNISQSNNDLPFVIKARAIKEIL